MSIAIAAQSLRKASGPCPLLTLRSLFCTAMVEASTDRRFNVRDKPVFLPRDLVSILIMKGTRDVLCGYVVAHYIGGGDRRVIVVSYTSTTT